MNNKKKRFLSLLVMLFIMSVGIIMVLETFNDNIIFFYSPTELKQKKDLEKITIRIGGVVKEKSIHKKDLDAEFIISDFENEIIVKYRGLLPSIFRDNQGIVAKGRMEGSYFIASEILAKHDENYMPREVVDAIKEKGQWRP